MQMRKKCKRILRTLKSFIAISKTNSCTRRTSTKWKNLKHLNLSFRPWKRPLPCRTRAPVKSPQIHVTDYHPTKTSRFSCVVARSKQVIYQWVRPHQKSTSIKDKIQMRTNKSRMIKFSQWHTSQLWLLVLNIQRRNQIRWCLPLFRGGLLQDRQTT